MVEWKFSEEDKRIECLIKTMKKEHLDSTLKKGTFCFNFPTVFNSPNNLAPAQQDRWDSYLSFYATKIYYAPIISEDKDGIHYGPSKKVSDGARIHQRSNVSMYTPLCSFRKVEKDDLVEKYGATFFRLGDTVDRIKNELGHDAFVFILYPHAFVKRISKISPCFARSIHYGELDGEFWEFLDSYNFNQKEMFQKSVDYAWQKEFRIIIAPTNNTGPQIINIGSIEDIAFGGDLETLRNGFVFYENAEQLKNINERIQIDGWVYD